LKGNGEEITDAAVGGQMMEFMGGQLEYAGEKDLGGIDWTAEMDENIGQMFGG
jgi:hypothetical protein